ncbi:hypothetical protein XENOCAPTIV_001491 [Xenoophorus captivus]|uniref:Otopetrin 2 n=1 Tax=Xenoophorus captivus TaxID=1517983 RepID=A0ABV0QGR1_9TELE
MATKDREPEEAHLSNNIKAADAATSESKPEMDTSSTEVARDRGRNWGWMLSAFICLNILILGCAFVSGGTSSNVKIDTPVLQIFIIFLFLLTSIWMVYYIIYNYRTENAVVFKDRHAGTIWLRASYGDDQCKCSHTSCDIFKDAYYYLYPFNIEYSLFASAMAFVMWKNVGRVVSEDSHHHVRFSLKDVLIGPVLGVLLVVAGIATFILYELKMKSKYDKESHEAAVMMHLVMNIVIVTMMSLCTIIGCAIFKLEHRKHVSEKNPTRSLDVGLLVGASLGQFIISYFSIIAMVATGAKGHLNRLNLAWGILMVIQLCLQNFFIIEGLHREPFHEVEPDTVVANPYVLKSSKDGSKHEQADLDNKSNPDVETRGHSGTSEHQHKLRWKRQVLREVCAFLLLGNIIVSIFNLFSLTFIVANSLKAMPLLSVFYSCGSCQPLVLVPSLIMTLKRSSTTPACGLLL